jgi:N-acetylglucosamine-6-phosphate deacetylase
MSGLHTVEGRLVSDGSPIRVQMEQGKIVKVGPLEDSTGKDLPWIGAGLIDLQINGFAGIDFNTPPLPESSVHEATRKLWHEGVTSYYPTVITNSDEAIEASLRAIAEACRSDEWTAASVKGIHLEGPFLSPEDGAKGAHDARYIKQPDWDLFQRWQEAAEGRLRILTLSPEWENAPAFISRCAERDVTVSIGHTSATPEQIREAVAAGARMSTHLGNGAHLMLPRHPNYIWEQLASEGLTSGIIADGFHLPESVLKVFLRAKGEQILLVSDAVYLSGLEPGKYKTHIGGEVVLTEEGKLHLASNPKILAGSAQMLFAGIEHLVRSGICTLSEAWALASERPAAFMGLKEHGRVAEGAAADLITFTVEHSRINLLTVYKQGQKVIGSSGSA